jgi:hypothetical protein
MHTAGRSRKGFRLSGTPLATTLALLLMGGSALGQDVGTVASTHGTATIERGGERMPAAVGAAVQLGDGLRTGDDGQLRVVFRDDSVIDLSERSAVVVDEQVFDPDTSRFSSLLRLVGGKARALVSSYYKASGASYEVQTPTAVAGVRGTSFIVWYDADADATYVIGIRGQVAVRSLAERAGEAVYVTAHEITTVGRGVAPTTPQEVDDRLFHHEIEGLQPLALGGAGGAAAAQSLTSGSTVSAPERAPSAGGLAGQLGRDTLRNSGDVAGQPLPVVGATRGSLGIPF